MNPIDRIKEIPIAEVFSAYGYPAGRSGFCKCPFHLEKTASCKVYKDSFYCFGCGAHGDSIDFVMRLFGLGFRDAVAKFCADFGLPASEKISTAEMLVIKKKEYIKKKEEQKKEDEHKALLDRFNRAVDWVRFAEILYERCKPENEADEFTDAFRMAVRIAEQARYDADEAMDALNNFEFLRFAK